MMNASMPTPWRRPAPVRPSVRPSVVMTSTGQRAADQAGDDGRGGFDRGLERRVVVGAGPGVEQHDRVRLPLGFVLAHDELAGAGGGTPVDSPEVVADLVLAQGQELLAVDRGAWNRTANGDALRSRPGAPGGIRSSCTRGQIVTSSAVPAVQLGARARRGR